MARRSGPVVLTTLHKPARLRKIDRNPGSGLGRAFLLPLCFPDNYYYEKKLTIAA